MTQPVVYRLRMADGTKAFLLIALLVALYPLFLVAMFGLARRYPDGVPPRWRWLLAGAAVLLYVGLSVDSALGGDWVWAVAWLVPAAPFVMLARSQKHKSRESQGLS